MDKGKLPQYRCHKVVRAAMVLGVNPLPQVGGDLVLGKVEKKMVRVDGKPVETEDEIVFGTETVDQVFWDRNRGPAMIGGYFVVYEDGYRSWSPAKAFDEGYKPLAAPKSVTAKPAPKTTTAKKAN